VVQQHDNQMREMENAIAAKDEAIQALAARLDALERGATTRVSMSEKQREARRDQVGSTPAVAAATPQQIEATVVLDNGR
jgi:Tfp pilus assembly protein FimV